MTDIQALVLGIRKECSWRKLAAGDTTVGSTPCCWVVFLSAADRPELDKCGNLLNRITPDRETAPIWSLANALTKWLGTKLLIGHKAPMLRRS